MPDGDMKGVVPTRDAMNLARDLELDLVEISPNADPPVCKIMDFGKYRYDESMREKKARKNQKRTQVKELKFHTTVEEHDYQTKLKNIQTFLGKGYKVKITLRFRGRENAHRELGFDVLKRVVTDCTDLCVVEMAPKLVGRSAMGMLAPKPAPKKGQA